MPSSLYRQFCTALALLLVATGASSIAHAGQTDMKAEYRATVDARMQMSDNVVEFYDRSALGRFYSKWVAQDPNINIGHFGDSHIQLGWILEPLRRDFQAARGNGGRGMIFPYAMAKTYSQDDYKSSFTGFWQTANSIQQPPRIGVGVSGFVGVTTSERAGFTIDFTKPQSEAPQNIRMIFAATGSDYAIKLTSGYTSRTEYVSADSSGAIRAVVFPVQQLGGSIEVEIAQTGTGGVFSLHGLDLRSADGGLVYHNLGVGGANYGALIQQAHFESTYGYVNPDLVILDWGTNDIIYKNAVPEDHKRTVERTIARIRAIDPSVTILLTNVQDMNYRRKSITAAAEYAELMRQIAREQNTLFYDWYRTSGGHDTMRSWFSAGWSSKDQIHLNGPGYRKRGAALADALFNMLGTLETRSNVSSLLRKNAAATGRQYGSATYDNSQSDIIIR